MKAFGARRVAIDMVDGSFIEQYLRLYDYCHELLRSNPNSTVKVLWGMILADVGRDPNDQMLPIALAVVEGETRDSWTWFLKLLIDDLCGQQACKFYTFISDQKKGLLPAMDELLPMVEQMFCVRHLNNNFRKIHPGKMLKELMWKATKSTSHQAWEREMKELRKVNEEAYKYLVKIPPRFWSKSRFSFNFKCDVFVNNMSETFNSVIIGPRGKPIVTMFEDIKLYLMERWARNRTTLEGYAGDNIFGVSNIIHTGDKFVVSLENKECSCRKWMLTRIPCCHAVCCCNFVKQDPEELISAYYRRETYAACYRSVIYKTNGQNLWHQTLYPDVLPPPSRRLPGRPKRSRNKDGDEKKSGLNNY
ncbi:uncharacterized protein [Cicer arietinum]|uniref:uncharacterized protein n=1 Tax=Cicer arietinum TaxID=3827 RepID=UPI003CC53E7E